MGAPNSAITASPMYLSSVPPSFCTMSVIRVRYSRSLCTTTCGSCFSVKVVKSRMSEKSTVTEKHDPQVVVRSEEHTSELQSPYDLVCRLLLETKNGGTRAVQTTSRQHSSV